MCSSSASTIKKDRFFSEILINKNARLTTRDDVVRDMVGNALGAEVDLGARLAQTDDRTVVQNTDGRGTTRGSVIRSGQRARAERGTVLKRGASKFIHSFKIQRNFWSPYFSSNHILITLYRAGNQSVMTLGLGLWLRVKREYTV